MTTHIVTITMPCRYRKYDRFQFHRCKLFPFLENKHSFEMCIILYGQCHQQKLKKSEVDFEQVKNMSHLPKYVHTVDMLCHTRRQVFCFYTSSSILLGYTSCMQVWNNCDSVLTSVLHSGCTNQLQIKYSIIKNIPLVQSQKGLLQIIQDLINPCLYKSQIWDMPYADTNLSPSCVMLQNSTGSSCLQIEPNTAFSSSLTVFLWARTIFPAWKLWHVWNKGIYYI